MFTRHLHVRCISVTLHTLNSASLHTPTKIFSRHLHVRCILCYPTHMKFCQPTYLQRDLHQLLPCAPHAAVQWREDHLGSVMCQWFILVPSYTAWTHSVTLAVPWREYPLGGVVCQWRILVPYLHHMNTFCSPTQNNGAKIIWAELCVSDIFWHPLYTTWKHSVTLYWTMLGRSCRWHHLSVIYSGTLHTPHEYMSLP